MRILLLDWTSVLQKDVKDAFLAMGYEVVEREILIEQCEDQQYQEELVSYLKINKFDRCFSLDYFPSVSRACEEVGLLYVSWIYDSPHIPLQSYSTSNECNWIFVFERELKSQLESRNVANVYHMPLGANTTRLDRICLSAGDRKRFSSDISFVGSLYSKNMYQEIDYLPEYIRGYVDGISAIQGRLYGSNMLQEFLKDDIMKEVAKHINYEKDALTYLTLKDLFAEQCIGKHVTSIQRKEMMIGLSSLFPNVALYTGDDTSDLPMIDNRKMVSYHEEMPKVFRMSKINMNLSLCTITTGIPLRCFDIMGAGGFLLTSYHEDFFKYFEPGVHFDYYTSIEEMVDKVSFYLANEDVRKAIGVAAHGEIAEKHTIFHRIAEIEKIIKKNHKKC